MIIGTMPGFHHHLIRLKF